MTSSRWPAGQAILAAQRLRAQLLSGPPAGTVTGVTDRLLAVQAQDQRGARLAIRARTSGLVAADVDRALTAQRSHVVSWLNRGTLHLVSAEDYWWLHPLTTPQMHSGNTRRLAQEGVPPDDAERGVGVIRRSLTADGPLTRAQLAGRVAVAGVRTRGQAMVHLLALATLRGLIVRGPMHGSEQAFVLVRDWLGAPPPPLDRDVALGLLARRYLAGHGPAADRDLAKWAGLPLGEARRGLAVIGSGLADRADGLASLAGPAGSTRQDRPDEDHPDEDHPDEDHPDEDHPDEDRPDEDRPDEDRPDEDHPDEDHPVAPLRLLGAFDPLLLGWASREMFLAPGAPVITTNGLFRPFVLVGGRGAAVWGITRGKVVLDPAGPGEPAGLLGRLSAPQRAALAAETADVERFLGQAGS